MDSSSGAVIAQMREWKWEYKRFEHHKPCFSVRKMSNLTRLCHCLFPNIVYPGACVKCNLTHQDAELIRIRAADIPFRFYALGDLTWPQYENLREQIDDLVYTVFNRFRHTILGENSVLHYFQATIFEEVSNLMFLQHRLTLSEQDEQIFKILAAGEALAQSNTD